MSTNRLEAFSDGVFAVAITLLVLNLGVPVPHGRSGPSLAHQLLKGTQWPHYAAFVVSFMTIGIIWINHHAMLRRLRVADHMVMTLNLLLLMFVVTLPFTTDLVATYLRVGYGHGLAAGLYAGSFLAMSLAFSALHHHVLFGGVALTGLSEEECRMIYRRNTAGIVPYVVATALAPLSAYASVGLCAAIAVFYALPTATSADQLDEG